MSIAAPASANVGIGVAVFGARERFVNSTSPLDAARADDESLRAGDAAGLVAEMAVSDADTLAVSGRSANACAAESTHCVMPVSVTRAMLSCVACSRCATCCGFAGVGFGVATTVVICASARAAAKVSIAASAARPKQRLTVPP